MDQDRHCGAVEMGHTTITLKVAKQTVEDPVKFSTAQFIKQTKKVNWVWFKCIISEMFCIRPKNINACHYDYLFPLSHLQGSAVF